LSPRVFIKMSSSSWISIDWFSLLAACHFIRLYWYIYLQSCTKFYLDRFV
jgi:hypothetical protein